MKNYEIWLRKYATFINDLEKILNDKDWREQLNEIAEDVSLAYDYRKALEKAPKKIQDEIHKLDEKLLKIGERLKAVYPPAYEYFIKHFDWLKNHCFIITCGRLPNLPQRILTEEGEEKEVWFVKVREGK